MFFLYKQRYAISVSEYLGLSNMKDEKLTENKELKDENKKIKNELKELKKGNNMVKYEKARLEEDNSQDIYYILDKMNKFDQSLKEHDVKSIIKHTSV